MSNKGFTSYDADLIKSKAIDKDAAAATDAIDLGPISALGVRSEPFEFEISLPVIGSAKMSSASVAFALEGSDDPTFASGVSSLALATATGGTAFDGGKYRYRLPLLGARYWRVKATPDTSGSGASIDDSVESLTFSLAYVC